MDSYRIPTGNGASEYVEKRSRFLGLVQPVSSEDEAREIIAACKKQYHDARHNCWCYLLRDGTERYSDDGEPCSVMTAATGISFHAVGSASSKIAARMSPTVQQSSCARQRS